MLFDASSESPEPVVDEGKSLSKAELFSQVAIFLVAGYETTMTTLTYTSMMLAMHPDVQDAVAEEIISKCDSGPVTYEQVASMSYLDATLKEAMRMHPPVRRFVRECVKPTVVEGVEFKVGDHVLIPVHLLSVSSYAIHFQ